MLRGSIRSATGRHSCCATSEPTLTHKYRDPQALPDIVEEGSAAVSRSRLAGVGAGSAGWGNRGGGGGS